MTTAKPILMNAAMVLATLREIEAPGTGKTQTRRIIKPQPEPQYLASENLEDIELRGITVQKVGDQYITLPKRPYGKPGDLLYVRESWAPTVCTGCSYHVVDGPARLARKYLIKFRADNDARQVYGKWTPSIHMPRWASRLTLEITDIRVERLQGISEADARAEGINDGGCLNCGESEPCGCLNPKPDASDSFCNLWTSINGPESWTANPWVWAVTFKPHLINVDQFIKARAA